MSDNWELLIIRHLRKMVSRPDILLFTRKLTSSMKQADFRDMFKKASNNVSTSIIMVSPDP